jgi:hypothetical protein
LFVSYNRAILREAAKPGSVENVASVVEQTVSQLSGKGVRNLSIHSDDSAEHGTEFRMESEDPIGCVYAKLRGELSDQMAWNGEVYIAQASELFPDLFEAEDDWNFARAVVTAHGTLASHSGKVIGSGRNLARSAVRTGAGTAVFVGEHDPDSTGIVNRKKGTRFDSESARLADKPAYVHSLWASTDLMSMLSDAPARKYIEIAGALDVLCTFDALAVEDVTVR